ncbi:MAG: adenosyl-hopene transferase HpnH [Candidatus Acidiferrum sp.]
MRYPLGLVLDSTKHIMGRKLRGERKFPVMLSLDPLGACPASSSEKNDAESSAEQAMLTVEQCLAAMDECNTPVVSVCGGEPLEYPEIAGLTRAILDRGHYLFLCTGGALIRRRLHMIPPYTNFFWNVKLDGTEAVHDVRANRPGLFAEALDGIKAAKNAGFFVIATSTIYPDTDVIDLEALFKQLHGMHVDGYLLSPHYPEQKLCRDGSAKFHEQMQQRFRDASDRLGEYNLMISPIYLEYLRGERELDCSVWGGPVYGPQGWSGPCSLLNVRYAESYKALVEKTVWENYGRGLNPRCENCQCHAGFETAALLGVNPKAGDLWKIVAWQLGGNLGERREGKRSG